MIVRGFRLRSGRSRSSAHLTRTSDREIDTCEIPNVAKRHSLWEMRHDFVRTNTSPIPFAAIFTHPMSYPNKDNIHIAEWDPRPFTLRGVCVHLGISRRWLDTSRYQMGDSVTNFGSSELGWRPVTLRGSSLVELSGEVAFRTICIQLKVRLAAGVFPAGFIASPGNFWSHSWLVDSVHLGDRIARQWRIL